MQKSKKKPNKTLDDAYIRAPLGGYGKESGQTVGGGVCAAALLVQHEHGGAAARKASYHTAVAS